MRRGEGEKEKKGREGSEGKESLEVAFDRAYSDRATNPGISFIFSFCFQRYSFFAQFEHLANISVFCAFLRVLERLILCKQLFSMIPPGSSSIFIALEFTTTYNLYMHSSSKNAKIKSF